jgi:hypothetical protein
MHLCFSAADRHVGVRRPHSHPLRRAFAALEMAAGRVIFGIVAAAASFFLTHRSRKQ